MVYGRPLLDKPTVPHAFRSTGGDLTELVNIRVDGSLHGDAHFELSTLPRDSLPRVLAETQQWYDPAGKGQGRATS